YFYQGQEIPDPPHDRWLSQWIINGKDPTLSNWPINFDEPTNSGFIDTEIMFVDGTCQIPHGAPYWGEYLDIVTQAYRGVLSYPNINARVVELNNDGSINWSQKGESVELGWLIDLYGRKIDNQGHILEERAIEPKGYVKMASPINGLWKLCHANIQPVEQGGFLITRNMAWH
ncbi:phage tail protein, partial [Providencia alcalifaciens]